jgi:WD40 repeat protein
MVATTIGYLRTEQALIIARQRKVEAEQARRAAEINLVDMYTATGVAAGTRENPYEAVLWFARAATSAANDPLRQHLNHVRFGTWGERLAVPVRALDCGRHDLKDLVFHSTGRYLMIRFDDGACMIWNMETDALLSLPVDGGSIRCAAWSPDGALLVLASAKGGVEMFTFPGMQRSGSIPHDEPICTLTFNSDGRYLAVAGKRVRLWDFRRQRLLPGEPTHPERVLDVVFDPRNQRIATTCEDNHARVFAIEEDQLKPGPLFSPVPHVPTTEPGIRARPAMLLENNVLLTKTENLKWHDATTGRLIRETRAPSGVIYLIKPHPSGTKFAWSDGWGTQIWSSQGTRITGARLMHNNIVSDAAFDQSGQVLATGSWDRTVRLWNASTGEPLGSPIPHQVGVKLVALSPDGSLLATASADDSGFLRIWRLPHSAGARHYSVSERGSPKVIDPAGRLFLSARSPLGVREIATGMSVGKELGVRGHVKGGAFSPNGQHLVVLDDTNSVSLWDWRSGAACCEPFKMAGTPVDVAYHPDGSVVVVVCESGEIAVLEAKQLRVQKRLRHTGGSRGLPWFPHQWIRFDPHGKTFVTLGFGNSVLIWDAASWQSRATLPHDHVVREANYSTDGRWLVTASQDTRARVWDTASGELAAGPLAHPVQVSSACFSPLDDRLLLTGCRDNLARLWDWRAGRLVCPAMEHEDSVFHVAFAPNGKFLFTMSKDGFVKTWEPDLGGMMAPRCSLLGPGSVKEQENQVWVSSDGATLIAARGPMLHVFELRRLVTRDAGQEELSADERQIWAELIAGRRIEAGGSVVLTTVEWLERWNAFRRMPGYCRVTAIDFGRESSTINNSRHDR